MAKKRLVTEDEYKRLIQNLKPGQILSVDLVEDSNLIPKGEVEAAYGADELHEPEGYGIDYDTYGEAMEEFLSQRSVSVSDGGELLDESEITYNGEKVKLSDNISWIRE